MMRNISCWKYSKLLIFLMLGSLIFVSNHLQAQTAIVSGYIFITDVDGISVHPVFDDGRIEETAIRLTDFSIIPSTVNAQREYDLQWGIYQNSMMLSPNNQYLAFVASQDEMIGQLFLLDLVLGQLEQSWTPFPVISSAPLRWSPDGQRLAVWGKDTFIYDVVTEQKLYTFDRTPFSPLWLPNSKHFVYSGSSNCAEPCRSDSDLYIVDIMTGSKTALTYIDAYELDLVEQLEFLNLTINNTLYAPNDQKIYFILEEMTEWGGPKGVLLLASVDLLGNLSIEADIKSMYPDFYSGDVIDLFVDNEEHVVLVLQIDDVETPFIWSVLQYDRSGLLDINYQRDFASYTDYPYVQIIRSFAISPNHDYLALGGEWSPESVGSVTVIDLSDGEVVWQNDELNEVCNVYWLNANQIVFGQPTDLSCTWGRNRFPFGQLIGYNLSDNSEAIIFDSQQEQRKYFISVYP